jgi:hypothetical protein
MASVDVDFMTEEQLNEQVLELTRGRQFDTAAQLIERWVRLDEAKKLLEDQAKWDALLNIDPQGEEPEEEPEKVVPTSKKKSTVKDRMKDEFGEWAPNA